MGAFVDGCGVGGGTGVSPIDWAKHSFVADTKSIKTVIKDHRRCDIAPGFRILKVNSDFP